MGIMWDTNHGRAQLFRTRAMAQAIATKWPRITNPIDAEFYEEAKVVEFEPSP